jgi:hypothetical protein
MMGACPESENQALPRSSPPWLLLLPVTAYFQTGEYREEGRGHGMATITMSSTGEVIRRSSSTSSDQPVTIRLYSAAWQRTLFGPGTWLEAKLTGKAVEIQADIK